MINSFPSRLLPLGAWLLAAALPLPAQSTSGNATTRGTSVPGPDPAAHPTPPPGGSGNPPDVSSTTVQTTESDSWDLLKDYTYDRKQELQERLHPILSQIDAQIAALNARRATLQSDTTDWDQAMKEVVNARADLKYKADTLGRASTPETFTDAKAKVGDALDRTRKAVHAVRTSRTN